MQTVNWMGFGVGLGIGLGMALAQQQQLMNAKHSIHLSKQSEDSKKEEIKFR
jgi:hypothetical protein